MNIDQVVASYPESLQDAISKELREFNIGGAIFDAISGKLTNLSSEPVARLLVPTIKSFHYTSQIAVINTALVAHEVLDMFPAKELPGEVVSHIIGLGEPLALRIMEQVMSSKGTVKTTPNVMLNLTKFHSCAFKIFNNAQNYDNEVVLAGCMRWHDIATEEMKSTGFNLSKVAAAHFHHEFSDRVAELMVKSFEESSHESIQYESYRYSDFFQRVLPHVNDKNILIAMLNRSNYDKYDGFKYFGMIAENNPTGVAKHLKSTNLSKTAIDALKCRIALTKAGLQALHEEGLLRSDYSSDVAIVLKNGDAEFFKSFFENHAVDTHTAQLLKEPFLKNREKFGLCNLGLKNPSLERLFALPA